MSGRAELHFAPEEGFSHPKKGPRLDRGQIAWFAGYKRAHGIHGNPPFHVSTVSARCRAPTAAAGAAGSVRVSVDGAFSVEQLLQAVPAQVSRVRGKPVVCVAFWQVNWRATCSLAACGYRCNRGWPWS